MTTTRIPLFPLEVVLFPGTPLPLHIFEPRNKQMIRECLEAATEFGVVLTQQSQLASVGCTAEVVQVLKTYEDGRMDILTTGLNAFEIHEVFEEKAYLEAEVIYLDDEPDSAADLEQAELLNLYQRCHALIYGRAAQPLEKQEGMSVAYRIASVLPLKMEYKQLLLEMRNEIEREASLRQKLAALIPELQELDRLRAKIGGNGHGRH